MTLVSALFGKCWSALYFWKLHAKHNMRTLFIKENIKRAGKFIKDSLFYPFLKLEQFFPTI